MESVLLNEDGDIEFDNNGMLKLIDGTDEILQRNKIALSINQGEWIFNTNLGIPWVEFMRDKFKDERDYEREIEIELDRDEDIEEIEDISSEFDRARRVLKIEFSGKLVNGDRFTEEVEVG